VLQDNINGIIIDKTKYKDKSLIIKVLTNNGELLSGIFYDGGSKLPIQFLNFYQISAIKNGKELFLFKDLQLSANRTYYEFSPSVSDQYYVVAELSRILFRDDDPGTDIFSFLDVELRYFIGEFNPDFHLLFLAKLIVIYGYMPQAPYEGEIFDFREGYFRNDPPAHPDYCDANLIASVFNFVNGITLNLMLVNAKDRYVVFTQLLRFLELQKGIKISLKSIEILREIRD
jgi:hypothetical protein